MLLWWWTDRKIKNQSDYRIDYHAMQKNKAFQNFNEDELCLNLHYLPVNTYNKWQRRKTFQIHLGIVQLGIKIQTESNNCFIIKDWTKKNVFASSLMASNTKCANLTWILLEIVTFSDITGTDFENSVYFFSQPEMRWWVQHIINFPAYLN